MFLSLNIWLQRHIFRTLCLVRDAENYQDHPSSVHVYKFHTISLNDLCSLGCNYNCTSDCGSYHMVFTLSENYPLTYSHLYNWYTERTLPYNYGFHSTSYNALMYAANVMHSVESIFYTVHLHSFPAMSCTNTNGSSHLSGLNISGTF